MKNILYVLTITATVIVSCGKKSGTALDIKKAELDSLQTELTTLKKAIAIVKTERSRNFT